VSHTYRVGDCVRWWDPSDPIRYIGTVRKVGDGYCCVVWDGGTTTNPRIEKIRLVSPRVNVRIEGNELILEEP